MNNTILVHRNCWFILRCCWCHPEFLKNLPRQYFVVNCDDEAQKQLPFLACTSLVVSKTVTMSSYWFSLIRLWCNCLKQFGCKETNRLIAVEWQTIRFSLFIVCHCQSQRKLPQFCKCEPMLSWRKGNISPLGQKFPANNLVMAESLDIIKLVNANERFGPTSAIKPANTHIIDDFNDPVSYVQKWISALCFLLDDLFCYFLLASHRI